MKEIDWSSVAKEAPKWFRDAKFGLFFHWGPYSVPACMNEWYSRNMYAKGLEQNLYHEKTYGSLHDFGYKDFYPMMSGQNWLNVQVPDMPGRFPSMRIIFPCGTVR